MLSVRHWRVGVYAASRLWLFPFPYGIGEFAKHKTVADIPSYARKLPCPVGRSCDSLSKLRRHVSIPWMSPVARPRIMHRELPGEKLRRSDSIPVGNQSITRPS